MYSIKINSKETDSGIYGVCRDCVKKALNLPENRNKEKLGSGGYVNGECDICHKIKPVANVKDYDFPVFEIKGDSALRRSSFEMLAKG